MGTIITITFCCILCFFCCYILIPNSPLTHQSLLYNYYFIPTQLRNFLAGMENLILYSVVYAKCVTLFYFLRGMYLFFHCNRICLASKAIFETNMKTVVLFAWPNIRPRDISALVCGKNGLNHNPNPIIRIIYNL